MRNMVVVGTIVSALSSQILPQLLFLAVMALGDGVDRLIPFMIFYVASMSGLLVWIYMMGRFGSRRTFLTALIVLAIGLVCFLLPFAAAIEWSAFLIGVGSIGVGSIMTTILSQLKEGKLQSAKGGTDPLVVVLIAWIGLFAYTLSRSYNLAVLLFLLSLLLPWRFVRRLPFEKTAMWTLSTPLFVRAFVVVTLFTLASRLIRLLEGMRGFVEVFLLLLIMLGYMGWVLMQQRTRAYVTAKQTRQVQFLAYTVGLFGGWTLIGAVFTSFALYSFHVLVFYVFLPFLAGVLGWILFNRTFTWARHPYVVLFVSSLVFFFGLLHPIAFIPVLFVSGYTQTMYSSIGHVQLYAAYGDNKEFASLVMQLWKKFGMVVAQSTLMIGLLTYGLIVGQTINGGVSFAIPRDWVFGVLLVTWSINVGLVRLYGWQAKPLADSHPK